MLDLKEVYIITTQWDDPNPESTEVTVYKTYPGAVEHYTEIVEQYDEPSGDLVPSKEGAFCSDESGRYNQSPWIELKKGTMAS
jgi:hypothetical protein